MIACACLSCILALPIPFDNLFPAWAILFFCLALLEDDGRDGDAGLADHADHVRLDGLPSSSATRQ